MALQYFEKEIFLLQRFGMATFDMVTFDITPFKIFAPPAPTPQKSNCPCYGRAKNIINKWALYNPPHPKLLI